MFQRAYNVRLYPNEKQKVLLSKTFGCCRKVYNCMLDARNAALPTIGTSTPPSIFLPKVKEFSPPERRSKARAPLRG